MHKNAVTITIFCLIIVGCVHPEKYERLKEKYNELQIEHESYKKKYDTLNDKFYLVQKQHNKLETELNELKQTADYYYKFGLKFLTQKEYQKAIQNFNIVIKRFPDNTEKVKISKTKISEINKISKHNYNRILNKLKTIVDFKDKITCIENMIKNNYLSDYYIDKLKNKIENYSKKIPPIEIYNYKLERVREDYEENRFRPEIHFYVQFKNNTNKDIIGVAYNFSFYNSFKKLLYQNENESSIRISAYNVNEMNSYLLWKDNPFTHDEVFDRLAIPVAEGTIKTKIKIKKVVFSDDSTWQAK